MAFELELAGPVTAASVAALNAAAAGSPPSSAALSKSLDCRIQQLRGSPQPGSPLQVAASSQQQEQQQQQAGPRP